MAGRLSAVASLVPDLVGTAMVETPGEGFTDITAEVTEFLRRCHAGDGVLLLYLRHTSASLTIQENADPDVQTDLVTALRRLAPDDGPWVHTVEGPDDMPAHIKAMLTGVSLHVPVRAGALNTIDVPVADFPLGDEFPLVRAVIFQGVQFPFEYDFTVGESFDLELNVAAKVATTPGGVGAWALFGLPQDEIASIIDKVKKDDRGQRLTQMLAEHVDTTGAAYVNRPPVSFLPACGVLGFELAGMSVVGGFLAARRRNRRRR